jgi:hypothetical protein
MRCEQLFVDSRLEVKALQKSLRGQLDKVLEAGAVLSQQGQVVTRFANGSGLFLEAAARRNIGFIAQDRIDARRFCLSVELESPVQIAVVGQSQTVHAQGLGAIDESLNRTGAVEQAEVAMAMQVDKRGRAHPVSLLRRAKSGHSIIPEHAFYHLLARCRSTPRAELRNVKRPEGRQKICVAA